MNKQTHYVASPGILLLAGCFLAIFGVVGGWSFVKSLHPFLWKSVPCEVLVFKPIDDVKSITPFQAEVKFRFVRDGKEYHGNQLGIDGWTEAREQLQMWQRFDANASTKCYLPDGTPAGAVLFRPPPKWGGVFFIVFSGCMGTLVYLAHKARSLPTQQFSAKVLPVVTFLFGGAGLFLLSVLSLPVWIESLQAQFWEEKPAKIIWREFRVDGQGKKRRNILDICYEYQADGKTWRNNRIYPGKFSAGNFQGTDKLLSTYQPRANVICRVNPKHPERSVLITNLRWSMLLTLFPIPFLCIGILSLKSLKKAKTPMKRSKSRTPR